MLIEELEKLPEEVKEVIFDPELAVRNSEIADTFGLNSNQMKFILDMEAAIYLKKLEPIELPTRLEEMERAKYYDIRKISLEVAQKILWPLQDYLQDVDRLILRLGGKVPRLIKLRATSYQRQELPQFTSGTVRGLSEKYSDFKMKKLTANKILNELGKLISPTIDNWIKDYVHYAGAQRHNSLERSRYLTDSPNAKKLSAPELETLRHFLTSYDDDSLVEVDNSGTVLKVTKFREKPPVGEEFNRDKFLNELKSALLDIEERIPDEGFILSEAGNDPSKTKEILWSAIGTQDKEKAIASLLLLLKNMSVNDILSDTRYKSLLKRFVSVRFGQEVENSLDSVKDETLKLRLFLEMILNEKLHYSDQQSAIYAYYIANQIDERGHIVYLDEQVGDIKWLEIQGHKGVLEWAEKF